MDRAQIAKIIGELIALEGDITSTLAADAVKIHSASMNVGRSWSGSTLGHHAEMYYEHFQRPPHGREFNAEWGTQMGWPHGWFIPTVEETEAEIRRISGVDLAAWKEKYQVMVPKPRDLRDALVVEIPTKNTNSDPRFTTIASNIEAATFDDSHSKEYLRQQINAHRASVSRDMRAITAGGVAIPTHLYYDALVKGLQHTQKNLSELTKNTRLLLRFIDANEKSNTAIMNAEAQTMMQDLANDPLILRKADGTIHNFRGQATGNSVITFQSDLPCVEGDIVERFLPSGQTDKWEIIDTGFHSGHFGIPANYQMKVRKVTDRVPNSHAGSVTNIYNVNGPNARFNSQSVDQSHNVVSVGEGELFQKLKEAIQAAQPDTTDREQLLSAVDEMSAHAGKSTFAEKFQNFMALASSCVTVITPFLPALATLAASVQH
ncbi:hypothetical protein [Granulicella sp. S156]|uniref:hypothetical protein n=1 Tax=Granulicella sp. S156 TaxID=1747224 RepID=UPI00131B569D|nr:hypothetical protein [Granulicella sp. S156]